MSQPRLVPSQPPRRVGEGEDVAGAARSRKSPAGGGDSDALLIARVLGGETEAYRCLVERYQRGLYSCAWQVTRNADDAEEAVQEAFVQAFMKLSRLREPKFFFSWAWRICTTVASKRLKRSRRTSLGLEGDRIESPPIPTPSELSERDVEIAAALGKLPDDQRQALTLRYWEGMDYAGMSGLLGVSEVALYQRVSRGLKRLRELLGAEFMDGVAEESSPGPSRLIQMPRRENEL